MKRFLTQAAFFVACIALLVACDYTQHNDVYVEIYFEESWMDTIKTKINYLRVFEDKIQLHKYVRKGNKGDIEMMILEFKKSEYDSLYFRPISN